MTDQKDSFADQASAQAPSLPGKRGWWIWIVAVSFVFLQFQLQLSSGVIVYDLMKSFSLSALGAGLLSGSYYYMYVALQIPSGLLADRFGARTLLALGAFVCAIGCVLFATTHILGMAEFGRLLMGMGASCAFVSTLYLTGNWFPLNRFAMMVGLLETMGMFGTVAGNVVFASLVKSVGWRNCIIGAAVILLVVSMLSWLVIRDRPEHLEKPTSFPEDKDFLSDLGEIASRPEMWINGLYIGFMFTVVTVFVALWGIPFLVTTKHVSVVVATFVASMVLVGVAVGSPIVGWLCHRVFTLRTLLVGGAAVTAVLMMWVIYDSHLSIITIGILLFFVGFFVSVYVLNYAISYELAPVRLRSTSVGFCNTLAVITAPIIQPLIGLGLKIAGHRHPHGMERVYTSSDYHLSLSLLPLLLIASIVLAFYIPQTREGPQ